MSLPELAAACRIVIVAVPIAATIDVIREVGPLLPEDALLMDLTSLKEEPVRAMLAASRAEVIGCHPLFGPDVPSMTGQNIVLCPARGGRWLGFLQGIFAKNGARITVTAPAEHDRMMALIQGLTHLETILTGLTLRDSGVESSELEAFSTPVFRTKQAIAGKGLRPPTRPLRSPSRGKPEHAGAPGNLRKELPHCERDDPAREHDRHRGPAEEAVTVRRGKRPMFRSVYAANSDPYCAGVIEKNEMRRLLAPPTNKRKVIIGATEGYR